jgi:hypothetical protein
LEIRRPDGNVHARLRERVVMHLLCGLMGYRHLRFGSCPLRHLGFRNDAFNRHGFRDHDPVDLCI